MSAALERVDALLEESTVVLDAAWRLEDLWQIIRSVRCPVHDDYVILVSRNGVITFFCGCQRRPTRLE